MRDMRGQIFTCNMVREVFPSIYNFHNWMAGWEYPEKERISGDGSVWDQTFIAGRDFRCVSLMGAHFVESDFSRCDFRGVDFRNTHFYMTSVSQCLADAHTQLGENVDENGFYLLEPRSSLPQAKLIAFDLRDVDLRGADLNGANLSCSLLQRSTLEGASLYEGAMERTNLTGAVLRDIWGEKLSLGRSVLLFTDFMGADLSYANLTNVDAEFANFRNANLRGATLSEGIFHGADFRGADLRGTNFTMMKSSQFRYADFRKAFIEDRIFLQQLLEQGNVIFTDEAAEKYETRKEKARNTLRKIHKLDFAPQTT